MLLTYKNFKGYRAPKPRTFPQAKGISIFIDSTKTTIKKTTTVKIKGKTAVSGMSPLSSPDNNCGIRPTYVPVPCTVTHENACHITVKDTPAAMNKPTPLPIPYLDTISSRYIKSIPAKAI